MSQPLADHFQFWTPPTGHCVEVGPEQHQIPLPQIPLPIRNDLFDTDTPSDDAIGASLYDYLRQFPECPHNSDYAIILRDAYPHYLADLGSLIVMLDHKEVDAPYVKRKVVAMQILLLLDPENKGLHQLIGTSFYEMSLMFPELPRCREHLIKAMRYLAVAEQDPTTLDTLARIDYLMGDWPKATERWERLAGLVDDAAMKNAIMDQVVSLRESVQPEKSLLEGLEQIGEAMELMAGNDPARAKMILEQIEEENIIPEEFPNPEFYYMLGICRERTGDRAGAFDAFERALQVDPEHEPSIKSLERITEGDQ